MRGHPDDALDCEARRVGREQHIGQSKERIVRLGRLGIKDVESGAGNDAVLECRDQRRLVHNGPARAVDQEGGPLHHLELRLADHPFGLRVRGHVQRDEIRGPEDLWNGRDAGAGLLHGLPGNQRVVGQHLHVEGRLGLLAHQHADPPHPKDPDRLPVQIEGPIAVSDLPVVLPGGCVVGHDPLRPGQHEGQDVLGHRQGIGSRRDTHQDLAPGRRRHIDVVVAHAVSGDDLETGGGFDHRRRDRRRAHQHTRTAPDLLDQRGLGRVGRHPCLELLCQYSHP